MWAHQVILTLTHWDLTCHGWYLWEWSLWPLWGSVCIICLCLFTFVLMRLFAFLCVLNPWWAFTRQNLSQCAFVSISFSFAKKVAGVFLLGFDLIICSIALPFIRYAVYSTLFWGKSVFLQSAYQQLVHMWSLMGRVSEEAVSDGHFDLWIIKLT